jgi:tetratricopeptide (TPR) repeat protein
MKFISIIKAANNDEKNKDYTKAYNLYIKAENLTSNNIVKIKLIAKRAWCLEQVGNHASAETLISELITKYPRFSDSFLNSALYYIKIKKYKQAKTILKEGLKFFPNSTDLYITLAYILKESERWNESIEILKQALLRETLTKAKNGIGKQDIWNELGHLYFDRGNYNSCIACLKKAILIDGDIMSCYSTIAKSYLFLEDPQNSIKYLDMQFSKFEVLDPEDHIIKARAYAKLKNEKLAMEELQKANLINGGVYLRSEDLIDFSDLLKNGFLNTLENLQIEE